MRNLKGVRYHAASNNKNIPVLVTKAVGKWSGEIEDPTMQQGELSERCEEHGDAKSLTHFFSDKTLAEKNKLLATTTSYYYY